MLVDGLIEAYPDNSELLTAGCQAYTAYASSFVEDTDPEKAEALYAKAKGYGFRALSKKEDFQQAVTGQLDDFVAFLKQYNKRDVPSLFWTASAWGKWISLNLDSVEALADMAMLEATMQRTLELDDSFYYGGPHLLLAVYFAARPDIIGGNILLSAEVLFARYYAVRLRDRVLFAKTLKGVIDAPVDEVPELTLANTLAKEKAREMLEKVDDYFGELP
jgi:hypothetical protein